ncbi:unnamed protein product [Orchesella dallaii]|uniref:Hexosyltransferase n=1 Tax=Orchesella dallaii TaxID=48710 RepID=A0ABP1RA28_9HEXA
MRIKLLRKLTLRYGAHLPSNWYWKQISEMLLLTLVVTTIVVTLKLLLHGVPLRSTKSLVPSEDSKLLDLHNFKWIANNASICELNDNSAKLLVILVHTARDHFVERRAIRESWGSLTSYLDWSIRVIFLLGEEEPIPKPHQQQVKSDIETELVNNGDLVMGNFVDTYRNLSYKHIMGYKWVLEYCSHADFVWKVDDDMFIDTLTIIDWRATELERKKKTKLIDMYCPVIAGSKPQREDGLKWSISKDVWPFDTYPTYCSGVAYGISMDWIRKIYSVTSHAAQKILWIDDVYVTGILPHLVYKQTLELPVLKFTWPHFTFDYNPYNTTFCLENRDTKKDTRNFGVIVRLLRGTFLERESRCLWNRRWGFEVNSINSLIM